MMRMVAGKPCVGEEFACMDVGKKLLREFKEVFSSSLTMNICDIFPILRWRKRDEVLGRLFEEIKLNNDNIIDVEKMRPLIETLFSLRKSEPEFFSDDVIKSLTLMVFVAGTETTAITTEWAMSLLLNHPKVLQKVKAEIDSQVGCERLINDLDLAKLPYLHGVINERLRLYPTSMHRDPKLWEEPTKFKPERLEEINGEREGFKFIPFGIGRRVCPGAGMAMRVMSLALGAFIQCFDWKMVGKKMVDMTSNSEFLMAKNKSLEAVCTPCSSMTNFLSQL
ncbi:hypothetical protein ACB092_01G020100 [Castanea dentata]